jgi:hypothetical protein
MLKEPYDHLATWLNDHMAIKNKDPSKIAKKKRKTPSFLDRARCTFVSHKSL